MTRWLPPPASSHAGQIDFVLTLVHVLMLVLFVGWSAYFLWVLIRFRRGRQPRADAAGAKGRIAFWTEVGVVAAEVDPARRLRAADLVQTHRGAAERHQRRRRPDRRGAVRVERALPRRRTASSARRRSRSSRRRTRSASIAAPLAPRTTSSSSASCTCRSAGRSLIQLSSKDAIHSFGVPAMRVKQDAIPGLLHAGVVHANLARRVRHRVLAALRARPLPDARHPDGRVRRGVPQVPGRRSRASAVTPPRVRIGVCRRSRSRPEARRRGR